MDVELQELRDFLAQHAPFDGLPSGALDRIPRRCTMRYARRGTVVLDVGQQGAGLYVIRSGAVEVVDELGGLVERVAAGGAFGMTSLLEHRPTRHRCTAIEDTLLVVLPSEVFDGLAREHAGFATYYAAAHHDRLTKAITGLQQAASGITALSTPVRDLLSGELVATTPSTSVAEAAATMSRTGVSSILVTDERSRVHGIVTDRDLRNRVLAVGRDPGCPLSEVMTSPAITVRTDALAFEALLEMVSRRIHHLPVVADDGSARGMVTTTDLLRLENSNPVYLAADLGRQTTLPAVVALARQIPSVLGEMVDRDLTAADISRIVTALGDAVRRRVVALVEAELGTPPTPYAWVVLGSVAREEEALAADQDHALVLVELGHDEWFAELAGRVVAALEEIGWPRCRGDVMATNPRWRNTVEEWQQQFARWSREPEPEAVIGVAIFHDMRHMYGEPRLTAAVRQAASTHVSSRLLGHLGGQALRMRPPLGFFRGLVLEKEGEHADTLDIKRGIGAVVQLARVHALRAGSTALSTHDRLDAAADAGTLDRGAAADLSAALELMSYRRLRHQVSQFRADERPDNAIDPRDLTEWQRRHLRDAFTIIRTAQQQLGNRLGPGYL